MSAHSAIPGRPLIEADADTVTLWHIKRRLGATGSDKRICAFVTELIDKKGFPPPLPAYSARRVVEHVIKHSRWIRVAVDTWFDNFLPPEASAAIDAAAMAAAAADMDDRAGHLRLVGGREA